MTKWPNSVLGLEKWFSTEGNVFSRDYLAMPGDLLDSHQQFCPQSRMPALEDSVNTPAMQQSARVL